MYLLRFFEHSGTMMPAILVVLLFSALVYFGAASRQKKRKHYSYRPKRSKPVKIEININK